MQRTFAARTVAAICLVGLTVLTACGPQPSGTGSEPGGGAPAQETQAPPGAGQAEPGAPSGATPTGGTSAGRNGHGSAPDSQPPAGAPDQPVSSPAQPPLASSGDDSVPPAVPYTSEPISPPVAEPAPETKPALGAEPATQVPRGEERMKFDTIARGTHSGLAEREALLVTDPAAWQQAWTQHTSRTEPPPSVPDIDFSREAVIVVAMGERNTGGYGVEIESVLQSGERLQVTIHTVSPKPGGLVTQALTQPFHIVRIPRPTAGAELVAVWE